MPYSRKLMLLCCRPGCSVPLWMLVYSSAFCLARPRVSGRLRRRRSVVSLLACCSPAEQSALTESHGDMLFALKACQAKLPCSCCKPGTEVQGTTRLPAGSHQSLRQQQRQQRGRAPRGIHLCLRSLPGPAPAHPRQRRGRPERRASRLCRPSGAAHLQSVCPRGIPPGRGAGHPLPGGLPLPGAVCAACRLRTALPPGTPAPVRAAAGRG